MRGTVTAKTPNQIFLDTGGVEWDISVSEISSAAFPPEGASARVFVWLYHREDSMRLFGFTTEEERALFLELQTVEGIGPKAALKILSGISARDLLSALQEADIGRLEKISGIGKKTAQKMLLTLQNKLASPVSSAPRVHTKPAWEDVVVALVHMGYDRRQCEQAVAELSAGLDADMPRVKQEEELFRRVVVELSK